MKDIVQSLLKNNADVNAKAEKGDTALHVAAANDHTTIQSSLNNSAMQSYQQSFYFTGNYFDPNMYGANVFPTSVPNQNLTVQYQRDQQSFYFTGNYFDPNMYGANVFPTSVPNQNSTVQSQRDQELSSSHN